MSRASAEPAVAPGTLDAVPDPEAIADRWMAAQSMLERRFTKALGGRLGHELGALTLLELDAVVQLPAGGSTVPEMALSLGLPETEAKPLVTRLMRRRYLRRESPGGRVVLGARGESLNAVLRAAQTEVLEYLLGRLSGDLRQRMYDLSADIVRETRALRDGSQAPVAGPPA